MIQSLLETGYLFAERYRLEKFLGAGGFAVVWRAYDTLTNTSVALKIFTNLDDQSIQDLASEYRTVQDISHPAIIRAEHFDRIGNNPYLVMKFADGGNLAGKVGLLNPSEVMAMMRHITRALEYIHQRNLIHQDIKPANILVDHSDNITQYVLSDFGISSKSRTRLSQSVKDAGKGDCLTYAYAPPEKFSPRREERLPNPKGDIFSLGITAYELLTGHLPFDDLDTGRELFYHPEVKIDFSEISDNRLRNIIAACLQANPGKRPNASQLKQLLDGKNAQQVQNAQNGPKTSYGPFHEAPSVKVKRVDNTGSSNGYVNDKAKSNEDIHATHTQRIEYDKYEQKAVNNNKKKKKSSLKYWVFFVIVIALIIIGYIMVKNHTRFLDNFNFDSLKKIEMGIPSKVKDHSDNKQKTADDSDHGSSFLKKEATEVSDSTPGTTEHEVYEVLPNDSTSM